MNDFVYVHMSYIALGHTNQYHPYANNSQIPICSICSRFTTPTSWGTYTDRCSTATRRPACPKPSRPAATRDPDI